MDRPRCRRCARKFANRPRGLCWSCYYTPGVREKFETIGPTGRRSPLCNRNPNRPASAPTGAAAGSDEKMRVLAERAANGESLWHPDDSRAIAERTDHRQGWHNETQS